MRLTRPLAVAAAALLALAVGTAVPAAADDRVPDKSDNITLVGHADNPFQPGEDPNYINTDLAFSGDYVIQGNYNGFSVYDIKDPTQPTLISAVACAGGQGDVSAVGPLVFISIDETMSSDRCDAVRVPETTDHWDGMRIFDITDPANPQYVKSIETPCGSHTHTVVPDPANDRSVFIYVDAYSRGASTTCNGLNPMQIVQVNLDDAASASVVQEVQFFDYETAWGGGAVADGGASTRPTTGCHDLTAYPALQLAVAGCRGDGLLLSITDPLNPTVLQRIRDPNVAFWHSGIFANDGSAVVFQDELGDAFINTCSPAFGYERGADAAYTLADNVLTLKSYFKIPRVQSDLEKCTAHSGSTLPIPDRFVVVQAWLEGGISVIDFTDPAAPKELAWYDKPTYGYSKDYTAGVWAVYYYNGYLFSSDMWDGLDVLRLSGPEFTEAARYSSADLNPQTQPQYDWVWRTAPTVPTTKTELDALPKLTVSPSTVAVDSATTLRVSAPAGTFTPGETVDVWWMDELTVLATVRAAPDGSLRTTEIYPGHALDAGSYEIVARGDRSAPAIALGTVEVPAAAVIAPSSPVGMIIVIALALIALAAGIGLIVLLVRRRGRTGGPPALPPALPPAAETG